MAKGTKIDKTAQVHPKACLDSGVEVGRFSVIGEKVTIGRGTIVENFCFIDGSTSIGKRCRIFSGAIIGTMPQDLKYKGENTRVCIGDENIIREYVTINRGTVEGGATIIGNKNLLMAYAHIAHDCHVRDETVIANAGTLAGHVGVESRAVIGGMSAIHQFVRVGTLAIVGGCSKVVQDVPPFSMVDGHPARIYGLNKVGLTRAALPEASVRCVKKAFRTLFFMRLAKSHAVKNVQEALGHDACVASLLEFMSNSKRGVCPGISA